MPNQSRLLLGILLCFLLNCPHIRANDSEGFSPLHHAAMNNEKENVIQLIKQGADIHASPQDRATPLHLAAMSGCNEIVTLLLKAGANMFSVSLIGIRSLQGTMALLILSWKRLVM